MSPKRTESHIIGEEAVDLLKRCLPKHWILRDQGGNNDYGIDVEIEIVESNGEVTGALLKGQVKGHKNIEFENGYYKKSISTDKLKYWLRIPMPVILFEVDTSKGEIFWTDIQLVARRQYSYLNKQNTRQIEISSRNILSLKDKKESELSLILLLYKTLYDYHWKNTYDEINQYFRSFVYFLEVWSNCRYFDFFMEMEYEEVTLLKSYYKKTKQLAKTFYIEVNDSAIPLFDTWYNVANEKWDRIFTYRVGLEACESILKYIIEILDFTKDLILNLEADFWANYDPEFQQELRSIDLPVSTDENELLKFLQKYSN